jgi:hypothetical protein
LLEVLGLLGTYLVCLGLVATGVLRSQLVDGAALPDRHLRHGPAELPLLQAPAAGRESSAHSTIKLFALDHLLFGFEPAVWADQFVTPTTTEWFAFFYFCYFLPARRPHLPDRVRLSRSDAARASSCSGMLIIVCLGPHRLHPWCLAFGPFRAFPELVPSRAAERAVDGPGVVDRALERRPEDIFPSLHTAGPCFIAMFSFRNRDRLPFRYTWPLLDVLRRQHHRRDDVLALALRDRRVCRLHAGDTRRAGVPAGDALGSGAPRAQACAARPAIRLGSAQGSAPDNAGRAAA